MEVTKANLATYLAGLAPSVTPYPIEITETIASDWGPLGTSGTVGNIIKTNTPSGVYLDLGLTVIPNGVTNMSDTFYRCTSLTTAPIIPTSVIGMYAPFNGCTSLTTAPIIPNSVTSLYYTFRDCTALTTAPIIPSSATNMSGAFFGCTALHTIQNFLVDVDNCNMTDAFRECPALANIYVTSVEESSWHLLHTNTGATGTDYTIYNPDGTVAGSGTVAGTSQVLTLYGKSDELVISANITPTLAEETATSQVQWHKSGLPYDDELMIFNAKNPDTVISNFITVNRAGEEFLGNSATATAPFYQWKKQSLDLYRYAAGESPATTFYWYKLCKITTTMTFDIEVVSDTNYPYRASYRLSVTYYSNAPAYTVSLFNLGQSAIEQAKLAVALDADGYLYIQTNAIWGCSLHVTLLYSATSGFSVTMDKLGYAPFGTESGFTPVNLITQTGALRWLTSGTLQTYTPIISTNIIGNVTGNASTADKWKTARNITISDADGTNTGTAVSVDGSENETLKLPSTIKANVTGNVSGNATTASNGFINIRQSANFTLGTYLDGTHVSVANTHATNTITCTLPTGQTCCGQTSFVIQPKEILDFELTGANLYCLNFLTTYKTLASGGIIKTEKYSDGRLVVKGAGIVVVGYSPQLTTGEFRTGYCDDVVYPIPFTGSPPLITCTVESTGYTDPAWYAGHRNSARLTVFKPLLGSKGGGQQPTKFDFIAEGYWE